MNLAMRITPDASPHGWQTLMNRQRVRSPWDGPKTLMNLPGSQLIALLQQRLSLELMAVVRCSGVPPMNDAPLRLVGVRGATTCPANTATDIRHAAVNNRCPGQPQRDQTQGHCVLTFSVTADLDACFPAAEARQREGWDNVALLDCQQMSVQGDLCAASASWLMSGCRQTRRRNIPTSAKPVSCDQTDLVTTDSSAAGPETTLPAMGLRRISTTESS